VETAFAKLQQSVVMAVASPPTDKLVDPTPVLDALRQTLAGLTVKGEPQVNASLETTIAGVVQDWAREKAAGCPFDVLMDQVKARQPGVTLGEFHDTLRGLHDAHRIRLSGWARSLDEMPDPELALFISHKVMYYANPAHQQT
jgi:hypothetical protein